MLKNEIVGGDNWQGLDKNDSWTTLKCYGNCTCTISSDGSFTKTGDSMTLD